MGIYLAKDGGLTEAQKEMQMSMGISVEEMKKFVMDRLIEIRGGKTPQTYRDPKMKQDEIYAANPVLIVGSGPSWRKYKNYISNFPNIVIAVDVLFNELVESGIKPDIVVTLESSSRIINPDNYLPENLGRCKHKTTVVGSSITAQKIRRHIIGNKIKYNRFVFDEEPRCSNVGNFAMNYAYNELHADKIFLLGFEHNGTKYPPNVYVTWQTDFWYFIRKFLKETIVNVSDGGALYYEDYILDTTLDKVDIKLV